MSLPYTKSVDINIHEGEFKQAMTINRVFNRLLANDKYLENEVKTTAITAQGIDFTPVSAIKHLYNRSYSHTLSTHQGSATVWNINNYLTLSSDISDIKLDGTAVDNKFVTLSAHKQFLNGFREGFVVADLTVVRQNTLNPNSSNPTIRGTQIYAQYPSAGAIAADARNFILKNYNPPINTFIMVIFNFEYDKTRPDNKDGDGNGAIQFFANRPQLGIDIAPPKVGRYYYKKTGAGISDWTYLRSALSTSKTKPRLFSEELGGI